jgi:hypothetical protein
VLSAFSLGIKQTPGALLAQSPLWQPAPGTTWQIQFTGLPIETSFSVAMYDIDMFDSDASLVASLHAQGRQVVCYISAGSWEDWRPDANQFPPSVLGNDYAGWPGEKWLDIRQLDLLAPIMRARLDLCQAKGFDGVDPDNLDGYQNITGFPLTYQDQLTYNRWLADEAHARGLAIGLKNDPDQVNDLLNYFDWALTESCFEQNWCNQVLPFIQAGKAVFAIEYTDTGMTTGQFCPQANALGISGILKHRNLDGWQQTCGTQSSFRIDRQGHLFSDGSFNCGLASACLNAGVGADLAERIDVSEEVEAGDLVELDPEHPIHYRKARNSELMAGVIASSPGFVLGNRSENGILDARPTLALLGRVLIKATTENGPIYPGDLLSVSKSQPGYAMRCANRRVCDGALVGKALEALDSDKGSLLILLMR